MNVLVIGGTGIISTYVVKKCLSMGMEITVLNRGKKADSLPAGVSQLIGDINNETESKALLEGKHYDCVIQFVAFTVDQVKRDVRLFQGKTNQYIFISSASAYQKPVQDYPITEQTPLDNPYWEYSRNKTACETYLTQQKDLTTTIIRPSHTYNNQMIMVPVARWGYEYAHIKRLIEGLPIIIPGDGTSLWTITHASDFANSFVYVIGNPNTYHQTYHITSEKYYTWEQLTHITASALGVQANVVHIPSDFIIRHIPEMEGPLLGDKTWSTIFDNSKIKSISKEYTSIVGYEEVVKDVIQYYQTHKNSQKVSLEFETLYDHVIKEYLK